MPTKVLVFESDAAFAGELRAELGKLGCSTTVVDDGAVGLQQAAADRPDLILLSIELPRMNGFSVCNKLKRDPNLKDVPLVIMSNESSDETFEQHKKLRTRAEDYVHKPIAFGELLRHIEPLASFEVPTSTGSEADGAIIIDDEIEIGSSEYEVAPEDGMPAGAQPYEASFAQADRSAKGPRPSVDSDIEAFADAAFGRLTAVEAPEPVRLNGGHSSADSVTATIPGAFRPGNSVPAPRMSSVPPPSMPPVPSSRLNGVNAADVEHLQQELASARARAEEAERDLAIARNDVEQLRASTAEAQRLANEADQLRARLAAASASKASSISSRDLLDLREALNKKDKEILGLREQLSRKDREVAEARDRTLASEREKADVEDKLIVVERELSEARDKSDAMAADHESAKKAIEDLKGRLERARVEGDGKDRQLSQVKAHHAEETGKHDAMLAALRSELDQTIANERAEHAKALDQAEARRKADLERARREHDAAWVEARDQAAREARQALDARSAELRQEHDAQIEALQRAQRAELDRARADAEQAAREASSKHEAAMAAALEHAASGGRAALEKLRAEHAETVAAIESDRDARLAASQAKAEHELRTANDRLAKLDMDLSATRGELGSLRQTKEVGDTESANKIAHLEQALGEASRARDDLRERVTASEEQTATLQTTLASTRQELGEARERLASESARAEGALTKWDADRQSIERAKEALTIALAQIEEVEKRPASA